MKFLDAIVNFGFYKTKKKYVQEILDWFEMKNFNSMQTPTKVGLKPIKDYEGRKIDNAFYKQIVGSLMYLTTTRLDMMHVMSLISRYKECLIEIHFLVAKRIFCYLQVIVGFRLFYKKGEKLGLIGFTDSDCVGNLDN